MPILPYNLVGINDPAMSYLTSNNFIITINYFCYVEQFWNLWLKFAIFTSCNTLNKQLKECAGHNRGRKRRVGGNAPFSKSVASYFVWLLAFFKWEPIHHVSYSSIASFLSAARIFRHWYWFGMPYFSFMLTEFLVFQFL
jgi:hypothetical protein